jgi:hypothetical protein
MVKDIIIDTEEGDLIFTNGDLTVKNSDEQHAILVVNTMAGAWKQYPVCGVGIAQYLGSTGKALELKRNMSVQLIADGFSNVEVNVREITMDSIDYYINGERLS